MYPVTPTLSVALLQNRSTRVEPVPKMRTLLASDGIVASVEPLQAVLWPTSGAPQWVGTPNAASYLPQTNSDFGWPTALVLADPVWKTRTMCSTPMSLTST